mmetsp:Transcript_12049/g.26089  ORF Transcript_12049/g.26089 Transcript_12049/m.26089 type:complete len:295 (+) Transcript_12049:280-1164(+)|eukprot:CAMPEP_0178500508 /NCGR_PEP_ID=MMETSP0696-20121128/16425_1 /TAXON_ID=265572 /ORGANISM="Extubocellulus spinifer, Strain CCMP396" /LENGTH=294 /DNA_ID=CAMNT_0020129337 /DNA_START=162 /DNA_END=1046 /DNA_ORIENTATION=+
MAQVPSPLRGCLVIYLSFLACLLPSHHVAAQDDSSLQLETPPPSPSPTPSPWRCVNPDAPEADDGRVRRGSRTTVCLTVGPGSNWAEVVQYVRYVFRPTADEYSVYRIPNSFRDFVVSESVDFLLPYISIFTASDESLSFLRRYYDQELGLIYPFLTAVIAVNDGVITGITFDDACIFCGPSACSENTYGFDGELADVNQPTKGCAISKEACEAIALSGGTQCDLQLYVVWSGTDEDGNVLNSFDSRFSNFEPKQLQTRLADELSKLQIPDWEDINPFPSWDEIKDTLNPFGRL